VGERATETCNRHRRPEPDFKYRSNRTRLPAGEFQRRHANGGQRFPINTRVERVASFTLVVNWPAWLKKQRRCGACGE
jgi:hypothetical protein